MHFRYCFSPFLRNTGLCCKPELISLREESDKMPAFTRKDSDAENGRGKVVCVMDASTYLGLSIVQALLNRGYTVHATIQNGNEGEVESLKKISGERLKILYADMLDYHSIVDALTGCSGLFYTFDSPQYDEVIAEIEVMAAHNVVEACAHTETIEKVVFTSSVAAVVWRDDRNSIADLHERHWSDVNLCRKLKLWYAVGKTVSERTAWSLAMDRGVNMVTINAGLVVGPDSAYKTSGSTIAYLKGAGEMYENGMLVSADVRFVAEAEMCAFEESCAFGRYICFNQMVNTAENADNLAGSLRSVLPFPDRCEDSREYKERLSNKKLTELMLGNSEKH